MSALAGAAHSDVGRVRSINQDGALTSPFLVAVADGMGGHRAGEVASALALRSLAAHAGFASLDDVIGAVHEANEAIFDAASDEADLRGMGTTLCALALVDAGTPDERLVLVNVGDSRGYQLRDGRLVQLTVDHSLVQLMVREGQLRPEDAESHPQRNILTRALGIDVEVDVDSWELDVSPGDRYLICSDGLFNEVDAGRMAATLRTYADPAEAARVLVGLANESGGRDNVTCVVADVVEGSGSAGRSDTVDDDEATALAPRPDAEPPSRRRGAGRRSVDDASAGATRVMVEVDPASAAPKTGRGAGAGERLESDRTEDDQIDGRPVGRHDVEGDDLEGSERGDLDRDRNRDDRDLDDRELDDDGIDESNARPRRFTPRLVVFLLGIVAVLAVAGVAVAWFATRTYFVGFEGEQVVIYRGRPGGLLWFEPTVAERTDPPVTKAGLVASLCNRVDGEPNATSLGDARGIVAQLRTDQQHLPAPATPCGGGG